MRVKEQKKERQVNGEEAKERGKSRYSQAEAEKGGKGQEKESKRGKLF